ncbi:MAG: glycosyltransferase family 2 protein [Bacteroidia bacterium]
MKSICFFCSYSTSTTIANYIQYYLKELAKHFTQVVFITNEKTLSVESLSFLEKNKIELLFVENEGYDFGMWYKGMLKYNAENYDRVGLVNDSCILFKPLDAYFNWLDKQELDYAGMVDSIEFAYHIQSFFLILNKKAIEPAFSFFKQHGLHNDREDVIKIYELGLCKHIQQQGLKVGVWQITQGANPSLYAAEKMIRNGYPLIKKKILFNSFSAIEYNIIKRHTLHHNPNHYISIIKAVSTNSKSFDFNLLKADGYNPDLKKIRLLQLATIRYKMKEKIKSPFKKIYRMLHIRHLRNLLNFRIKQTANLFGNLFHYKINTNTKVAVCLICKDENHYLQEWLTYYRSIGINHFFIYDNNSKIPISETLANEKDCTVIEWKEDQLGKQMNAYFDCCKKNKNYDWILFIDTDEFLILKKHKTVQDFLSEYNYFSGVGINWICYTASGYENRVEWFKFNKFIPLSNEINNHIKSFVRPKYVTQVQTDPHHFAVTTVNEHKELINGPFHKHSSDIAFIRHNLTRSKTEYLDKISRGRGDGAPSPHSIRAFYELDEQATETEK